MIWIIVIETVVILAMGLLIWDTKRAIRTLMGMWEEEQNRQWIDLMEESGTEIIKVNHK